VDGTGPAYRWTEVTIPSDSDNTGVTMASAANPPASGMGRHYAEGDGYCLVLLASVLPVIAGCGVRP